MTNVIVYQNTIIYYISRIKYIRVNALFLGDRELLT